MAASSLPAVNPGLGFDATVIILRVYVTVHCSIRMVERLGKERFVGHITPGSCQGLVSRLGS